eukprot:gene32705-33488_t
MKLVGTTKSTITSVRDRSHWSAANIKPVDPVSLGICSQLDLDFAVQKAARKAGKPANDAAPVRTLIPASEVEGTAAHAASHYDEDQPTFAPSDPAQKEAEPRYDANSVFAKLKPNMRILIAGASGTIGQAVVKDLSRRHEIVKAGRSSGD